MGIDNDDSDALVITDANTLNGSNFLKLTTAGALTVKGVTADSLTFGGSVLSAYDEGTFTPGISFGGGTTGITYSAQTGKYTRIGNVVHISAYFALTNKGSSTGGVLITGFPITIGAANAGVVPEYRNVIYPTLTNVLLVGFQNGATTADIIGVGDNRAGSALQDSHFNNNSVLRITGFYFA